MRLTKGWGLGELEQPHPVSACPSSQAPGLPHSYPRGRGEETCVLPGGGALRGWELLGLAGPSGPTTHSGSAEGEERADIFIHIWPRVYPGENTHRKCIYPGKQFHQNSADSQRRDHTSHWRVGITRDTGLEGWFSG